ncbi:unnamed protein product [Orchesella dallaii]|uniref:Uncharacterized protein n=1 Tax=Orchesella dallaii TaxID=48710 RepID=A0ABP1QGY8_9HEXA
MKMTYPFLLPNETHSTFSTLLSVILFLLTLGPSIIFIESLEVIQTLTSFIGFQVVEAMNKHIEIGISVDVGGIIEHGDKRLHEMSTRELWSRELLFDYEQLKILIESLNECLGFAYLQTVCFSLPIYAFYTSACLLSGGYVTSPEIIVYSFRYYVSICLALGIPSEVHQQVSLQIMDVIK